MNGGHGVFNRWIRMVSALVVAVAALLVAPSGVALADAANPVTSELVSAVVDGDGNVTVTIQGTWEWPGKDCLADRYDTGWAVDWNDAAQVDNTNEVPKTGGGNFLMGTPTDNGVYYHASDDPDRCAGVWGPISYTYPAGTEVFAPCAIMYDLHTLKDSDPLAPKPDDLIAGGADRNKDNSVEKNSVEVDATACIEVELPLDLQLTKTDNDFEAVAGGDPIPYVISVQNVGLRDADLGEPVTVTDELPAYMSWDTVPDNCSVTDQVLTCDIDPALLTYGSAAVLINATASVAPDAPSGSYVNRAWVDTEDDPVCEGVECVPPPCESADENNNLDCEDTPTTRFASIYITKTDDVADGQTVEPGEEYSYELVVGNLGPSTVLADVVIDDDLPAQLSFVSAGGSLWNCNDADPIQCNWEGSSIAVGADLPALTVTVRVNDDATGTNIHNTAFVSALVDDVASPPALEEVEVGGIGTYVNAQDDEDTPLLASTDLAIVKTASVAQIGAGNSFNWVLTVSNNGPGAAQNVVVGDLVPAGVTVTGVSSTFFTCDRSGNNVSCTRASMAIGESGVITIAVSVPVSALGGSVKNVGTVSTSSPETNLDNNSDDASVIIVAAAPPIEIPKTGPSLAGTLALAALALMLLGGGTLLVARRRDDELDMIS